MYWKFVDTALSNVWLVWDAFSVTSVDDSERDTSNNWGDDTLGNDWGEETSGEDWGDETSGKDWVDKLLDKSWRGNNSVDSISSGLIMDF